MYRLFVLRTYANMLPPNLAANMKKLETTFSVYYNLNTLIIKEREVKKREFKKIDPG